MKYRFILAALIFFHFSAFSEDIFSLDQYDRSGIEQLNWTKTESNHFYVFSADHLATFKPVTGLMQNLSFQYVYQYAESAGSWRANIGNVSRLQFFSLPGDINTAPGIISALSSGEYAVITNALGKNLIFRQRGEEWFELSSTDKGRVLQKVINSYGESVWHLKISKKELYEFNVNGKQKSVTISSDGYKGNIVYYYIFDGDNLISIKDDSGNGYDVIYNAKGDVDSVKNRSKRYLVKYTYDEFRRVILAEFHSDSGKVLREKYFYNNKNYPYLLTAAVSDNREVYFESRVSPETGVIEKRDLRYIPSSNDNYKKPVFEFWSNGKGSVIDRSEKKYYFNNNNSIYAVTLPILLAEKILAGQSWYYLRKQVLIDNTQNCDTCLSQQEIDWSSFGNIEINSKLYFDGKADFESYYYGYDGELIYSYKNSSINGELSRAEYWSGKIGTGQLLQEVKPNLTFFYQYNDAGELVEIISEANNPSAHLLSSVSVERSNSISALSEIIEPKDDMVTIQAAPAVVAVRMCAASASCTRTVVGTGQSIVNGIRVTISMLMEYWNREKRSYEDCAEDCSVILEENPNPRPPCWTDTHHERHRICLRVCQEGGDHWKIIFNR